MSFVRAKEIPPGSGNWYDYEVMTVHEGGKVRQKHLRYLGKHGLDHSALLGGTATPDTLTGSAPTGIAVALCQVIEQIIGAEAKRK